MGLLDRPRVPAQAQLHACTDATLKRTVETDPRGKLTTYCHNTTGQVVQVWDALNRQRQQTYNAQASVTSAASTAGGTGNPLNLTYAANNTLSKGQKPAGETFAVTYCNATTCPNGGSGPLAQYRASQYQDEQGSETNYDYSAAGDLTTVRDNKSPTIAQVLLDYNDSGANTDGTLESATDANGNITTFGYTGHNLTTIDPPATTGAPTPTQLGPGRLNRRALRVCRRVPRRHVHPKGHRLLRPVQVRRFWPSLAQVVVSVVAFAVGLPVLGALALGGAAVLYAWRRDKDRRIDPAMTKVAGLVAMAFTFFCMTVLGALDVALHRDGVAIALSASASLVAFIGAKRAFGDL